MSVSCNRHLSSAQKPHVTDDYCGDDIGWSSCPYRKSYWTALVQRMHWSFVRWEMTSRGPPPRTGEKRSEKRSRHKLAEMSTRGSPSVTCISQSITHQHWISGNLLKMWMLSTPQTHWIRNSENDTQPSTLWQARKGILILTKGWWTIDLEEGTDL